MLSTLLSALTICGCPIFFVALSLHHCSSVLLHALHLTSTCDHLSDVCAWMIELLGTSLLPLTSLTCMNACISFIILPRTLVFHAGISPRPQKTQVQWPPGQRRGSSGRLTPQFFCEIEDCRPCACVNLTPSSTTTYSCVRV